MGSSIKPNPREEKNRKMTKVDSSALKRSTCPVANTLDIIGDKWTLLIVRDLLNGKRRYQEFENSAESVPSNILAERLKRLERHGLVRKLPYQDRPTRYEYKPSRKCVELAPVVREIAKWGMSNVEGTFQIPDSLLNKPAK